MRTHSHRSGLRRLWPRTSLIAACALMVSGSAVASPPQLNPGTDRYRAQTPSSATGRSGSAKLQVRALLGSDGLTSLEATTGTLDSAQAAPGNISKLQVKLLDQDGRARHTHNENRLRGGGYVHRVLPGLARGQPLQVQANVEGIDGARRGVVTVRAGVLRRPDLVASALSLPASAQVNAPVTVSALISELHGDASATGDCVLRVDGTEVDRAPGIWIAAGDSVSCAFTTAFTSTGQFGVSVEIANVVPRDDDPANNAVSGVIEIVSGAKGFAHQATVSSYHAWSTTQSSGYYTRVSGNHEYGSDWASTTEVTQTYQSVSFRGQLASAVTFPLTRFELAHWSDSDPLPGTTFSQLQPTSTHQRWTPYGVETVRCVWAFDSTNASSLNLCAISGGAKDSTSFAWSRFGGEVTYFSNGYRNNWTTDLTTGTTTTSSWITNTGSANAYGAALWKPGSTYRFDVELTDGLGQFRVTPVVSLQARHTQSSVPFRCKVYSGSYYQESCYGSDFVATHLVGSISAAAP